MGKFKVGIQLYSLKKEMEKDFEGTLKRVSEIGYDCVEFAGFYGHTADEINELLDKYGLVTTSVHELYTDYLENGQEKMDYLKKIGVKYFIIPGLWLKEWKDSDEYNEAMQKMEMVCDLAIKNGMKVLYHTHPHDFKTYEDKYMLECMIEDVHNKMSTQLDVCWVRYAGILPEEYMMKYKGNLPVLHMKDFNYAENKDPMVCPVGDGEVNIPAVMKAAKECGTEYLIVEQDEFFDMDPFEAIERSLKFIRSLDK